jgi:teichuronic acid biosynthesis glycosyltransferase TuaG
MSLISIIIPYFKKKNFFEKTIHSVLNQTYSNFEIFIVYDDESKDDLDFVKKISELDSRINLIINNQNLGAGQTRNIGIKHSNGEYIAFIDADDLWHQDKLLMQIKFMQSNNHYISHTSYDVINEKEDKISSRKAQTLTYNILLKSCDIGLSTVMLKKNLLNDDILFPELKTKEDYVLWLKITRGGQKIAALDKTLSKWRKCKISLSYSTIRKLIDGYNVYRKYLNFNPVKSFYNLIILSINYLRKK